MFLHCAFNPQTNTLRDMQLSSQFIEKETQGKVKISCLPSSGIGIGRYGSLYWTTCSVVMVPACLCCCGFGNPRKNF